MATIREGWKLPDPPACKRCGAAMRPLKHWHPETPLQWTCEKCPSSRLDPIIEWPFLEAVPADGELEALGFIVARPEEVDYAEARALASKYNEGYLKPSA